MDRRVKKKDDSTRFPTLPPEMMVVRPERPCESLEEEGSDMRPIIAQMTIRGRIEQKPSDPIPENSAFGPVTPRICMGRYKGRTL